MGFEEYNMDFCEIENFAYGEIKERSFSNPNPWSIVRRNRHLPAEYEKQGTSNVFTCINRWANSRVANYMRRLYHTYDVTQMSSRVDGFRHLQQWAHRRVILLATSCGPFY